MKWRRFKSQSQSNHSHWPKKLHITQGPHLEILGLAMGTLPLDTHPVRHWAGAPSQEAHRPRTVARPLRPRRRLSFPVSEAYCTSPRSQRPGSDGMAGWLDGNPFVS